MENQGPIHPPGDAAQDRIPADAIAAGAPGTSPASAAGHAAAGNSPSFPASPLKIGMMVAAVGIGLLGGVYFLRNLGIADDGNTTKTPSTSIHFNGWGKPELAIVFTGQMHGYMQPCGCSAPQFGGLARRYEFIQSLKKKGWPVVAVDVGEIAQSYGPQAMQKYITSMKALKAMDYVAIGLGKNEFNMPLFQALAHYSVENPSPTPVATNLLKTDKGQEFYDLNVRKYQVVDSVTPRIGFVSAWDPDRSKVKIHDKDCKFLPVNQALAPILTEMRKQRAQINIMLYQGTSDDKELGACLAELAQIRANTRNDSLAVQIALCLSSDPEPPGQLVNKHGTQVATVGHKGRYVGVLGLFKAGKGYQLKYELVPIGPEYETPEGKDATNPVLALMQEYAETLKRQDFARKFPRTWHTAQLEYKKNHNVDAKFVGSETCANCHPKAYDVWAGSPEKGITGTAHSHAFDALVHATRPTLRQHDGECIKCHTVGFEYKTGYLDPDNNDRRNKQLLNVGCENCHGPGSAHANDPNNKALYPIINPYRPSEAELTSKVPAVREALHKARMLKIDGFCQKCHDVDNDVHWTKVPFDQKWAKIAHPEINRQPAPQLNAQPAP